jgi:catechol 2,3-dioxygenase-like lactoylglutathione lyase family enzyme
VATVAGFMHVNVNCADLARSRRFYEEALGLVASAHTRPEKPQPGAGFGLAGEALWDAWVLDDPRGMGGAASLDLLRWETPPPCGDPPGVTPALGIHRLGYAVPALDGTLARLRAAGGTTLPAGSVSSGGVSRRFAWALDPDGSVIELVEEPACPHTVQARWVGVVCSDLERAIAWYGDVLGLTVRGRERAMTAPGASFGAPGDAAWDAAILELPSRAGHYGLRLEHWRRPATAARTPPVANQLGPFRIAFLVDDVRAWHRELERRGVRCSGPPVWLEMGPEIPIDGLWALFFSGPDGACLELIQTPELRSV